MDFFNHYFIGHMVEYIGPERCVRRFENIILKLILIDIMSMPAGERRITQCWQVNIGSCADSYLGTHVDTLRRKCAYWMWEGSDNKVHGANMGPIWGR